MTQLAMRSLTLAALASLALSGGCANHTDSVEVAMETNVDRFEGNETALKSARFLVRQADARMMDSLEGQYAANHAVNDGVREYGRRMVEDQAMLLEEIRSIASRKNIKLPDAISSGKADELENLRDTSGREVDEEFLKMIIADHKRDVEAFEKATQFSDPDVRAFAERRLPLIREHLREAQDLKASLK